MNLWEQRERALATLRKEVGYIRKPHGDRLRIALAFPNSYWVGMSNLGLQTVYRLFNAHDDIVCERFFLPPKQEIAELLRSNAPLLTLESQTQVADFDVVAFSVSFEWDYVNVLTLLRLARIPRYAAERTARHPLVMIGGAVTFVNPEPLALFADVVAAGEGEALIPAFKRAYSAASDRQGVLRALALERGFYVPSFYEIEYAANGRSPGSQPRRERLPRSRRRRCARRRLSIHPRRASSRRTPSSARASSSRWYADAQTSADSVGPATTTSRCARFPRIGFSS